MQPGLSKWPGCHRRNALVAIPRPNQSRPAIHQFRDSQLAIRRFNATVNRDAFSDSVRGQSRPLVVFHTRREKLDVLSV